jgi:hypothetical protein
LSYALVWTLACCLAANRLPAYAEGEPIRLAGELKESCRSLGEGYRVNREGFSALTCRFAWRCGTANSLEDAQRGQLVDPIEHAGLWIVDGERVRYELSCTSPDLQGKAPQARRAVTVAGMRVPKNVDVAGIECFFLKSATYRAHQSKLLKGVSLIPPDIQEVSGVLLTPFSLGFMGRDERFSPANLLKGVAEGRCSGRIDGIVEQKGRSLVGISVGEEKGAPPLRGFQLDPGRGFLPMHWWDTDADTGERLYEESTLAVKDCGAGRWFPMRSIVVLGGKDAPWPRSVQEVRVTELKLERPASTEFHLDLAAGTSIKIVRSSNFMRLPAATRIYDTDLESLAQRVIQASKARTSGRNAAKNR